MFYLCDCLIFTYAYLYSSYGHMAIPYNYQTAKFKSAKIFAMASWGPTTKFNSC